MQKIDKKYQRDLKVFENWHKKFTFGDSTNMEKYKFYTEDVSSKYSCIIKIVFFFVLNNDYELCKFIVEQKKKRIQG